MLLATPTIAEEEVPDAQQCVEREVAGEQTHQPISGEHERLHAVALQVSVGGWTRPLQDPAQHGRVKQDPFLQGHMAQRGVVGGPRDTELMVGTVLILPAAGCSTRAGTAH